MPYIKFNQILQALSLLMMIQCAGLSTSAFVKVNTNKKLPKPLTEVQKRGLRYYRKKSLKNTINSLQEIKDKIDKGILKLNGEENLQIKTLYTDANNIKLKIKSENTDEEMVQNKKDVRSLRLKFSRLLLHQNPKLHALFFKTINPRPSSLYTSIQYCKQKSNKILGSRTFSPEVKKRAEIIKKQIADLHEKMKKVTTNEENRQYKKEIGDLRVDLTKLKWETDQQLKNDERLRKLQQWWLQWLKKLPSDSYILHSPNITNKEWGNGLQNFKVKLSTIQYNKTFHGYIDNQTELNKILIELEKNKQNLLRNCLYEAKNKFQELS